MAWWNDFTTSIAAVPTALKRLTGGGEQSGLIAGLSPLGDLVAVLEPVGSGLKSVVVFQGEQK